MTGVNVHSFVSPTRCDGRTAPPCVMVTLSGVVLNVMLACGQGGGRGGDGGDGFNRRLDAHDNWNRPTDMVGLGPQHREGQLGQAVEGGCGDDIGAVDRQAPGVGPAKGQAGRICRDGRNNRADLRIIQKADDRGDGQRDARQSSAALAFTKAAA